MNILETRLNETKKNYELEKIQHLEKLVSNEEKIVRYISSPLFESWIIINLYFQNSLTSENVNLKNDLNELKESIDNQKTENQQIKDSYENDIKQLKIKINGLQDKNVELIKINQDNVSKIHKT